MRHPKETVGLFFDLDAMRHASAQSWHAVQLMAETFKPGLREFQARKLAEEILRDVGMDRLWHPCHVRFGSNTLKTFKEHSDGNPELGEDDIYFIDIGPVFSGHEGDVGATFTTGNDPDKAACAIAVKTLFGDVRDTWKNSGLAGPALYDYAARRADEMGWKLNLDIKGHRVSDFPHAIYKGGALGHFDKQPAEGVWILEIQIAHPHKAFGAFYEDLLI
jgi:Xaa-Pro aminopeptidase